MENSKMNFDGFVSHLEKFIKKSDLFGKAKETENQGNYKLQTEVQSIKTECEKTEGDMEQAIENELEKIKWFNCVLPSKDEDPRRTPRTSNLFNYTSLSSEMERWTQKLVWTFLRRKFFGTKNKDGKIDGGMIDITKLKQDQITKILNILVSPVTKNILPVSNFLDARFVMQKCVADDSEGIFNSQFLLQDLVDIYGINVEQKDIKTDKKGTKTDEYEKRDLTKEDKEVIMTCAEFDVLDAHEKDFPDEYREYKNFLLSSCGFPDLNEATRWVRNWKQKSDSGTSGTHQNPFTDPNNTKCKTYFAENLKDYSNDNKNKTYLSNLSSKLYQDGQKYSQGNFDKTEKYMSFSQYLQRFQNKIEKKVDKAELVEKLKNAKKENKSPNGILFSIGKGEPKILEADKLPANIYDSNNFYGVNIKNMEHQSYSAGCGSTVAATMMTYEGLELSQYEIRKYVPENIDEENCKQRGFGRDDCRHNPAFFSDIIIKYKNNMATCNLVIDWNNDKKSVRLTSVLPNLLNMIDKLNGGQILNDKDRDRCLQFATLKASEEEIEARSEYLRLCIIDAIVKHKSPISLNIGGHYQLVIGIQGNLLQILDPDSPRYDKMLIKSVEKIVGEANNQIDLFWFERLDCENINNRLKLKNEKNNNQVYDESGKLCDDNDGENFKLSTYGGDFKKFLGADEECKERMKKLKEKFPDADKKFEVLDDLFLPKSLTEEKNKEKEGNVIEEEKEKNNKAKDNKEEKKEKNEIIIEEKKKNEEEKKSEEEEEEEEKKTIIKDKSVSVEKVIERLKSSLLADISLSELKRIVLREKYQIDNAGDLVTPLTEEQKNTFIDFIQTGKIVISNSNLSEVFNFGDNFNVAEFVEKNAIARKFIYENIYEQLFDPKDGFFTKDDVKNSDTLNICESITRCLGKICIVLKNDKKIDLDLSKFENEFLLSVGAVDFQTLFKSDKKLNQNLTPFTWFQDQELKISDRNFDAFLKFMELNIEDINSNEFIYCLQKIGDSSLGYDNVEKFVSLLLSKKEFDDFGLIKQLIDRKLRPIQDGDDRIFYSEAAKRIFCEYAEKFDDASGIILVLYALIRKQDECYQCGKLIDALNEVCAKHKFDITQEQLSETKDLIENKILITDMHSNLGDGYKFVVDFQLTKNHLTIPINVKYLNEDKNEEVNDKLNQYIGSSLDKLNCECDISDKKSFDNIISQIKSWFNDKGGKASQGVTAINKKSGSMDGSDDNFIYILKSKCEPLKLKFQTLQTILRKIFNDENKINDEKVFFEQFGPWFCHILSNYLDFSSVSYNDLCALMDECLGKNLKFKLSSVNDLIDFLKNCIEATKKNNRSCVDLSFMVTIFNHIDLNPKSETSEIFSMFDFICENAYQMKVDEVNTADCLNQLVSHMVLRILKSQIGLKDKKNRIKELTDKLNEKCFCGLVQTPKSHSASVTSAEEVKLTGKNNEYMYIKTIQIEVDKNGFINKIYASTCQMSGANNITIDDQTSITLFENSNKNPVNDNSKRAIEKSYKEQKAKASEELEKEDTIKQQDEKNTEKAKSGWNTSKNAQKQAADQNNQSFLLEEVKNEFDNAFTKAFGNLNKNEQIENYDKLGDFLKNVQKIWDLVEICKFREDLKNCLGKKIETFFRLRIKKESLTLEQIVQLVDLKYSSVSKDYSIKIDQFLGNWCKPYLNAVNNSKYALPKKIKIKNPVLDTLEVFALVVLNKKFKYCCDAKIEIQTFLDSQLFEQAFGANDNNEYNCDEYEIKNKISEVVTKLINQLEDDKIQNDKNDKNDKNDMEDMFFKHLNNILKDRNKNLHIKTHAEEIEEQRAAQEKEEKNKQNQSDKLLKNIEQFTKINEKKLTRESVKNIFKDVDLKNIEFNLTKNKIDEFMNLLKQVNEKVKSIEEQKQENQNLGAEDFTQKLTNLKKLFMKGSLTKDQFKTFTVFIASMQYCITGNKLGFQDLYANYGNLLENKIDKATIGYVENVFEAYKNSDYIVFENTVHLANFLNDINFAKQNENTKQQIVELINQYDIFYKAICDEIAFNMQSDADFDENNCFDENNFCEQVETAVGSFFDAEGCTGIYINGEKLCYSENKKVDENDKKNHIKRIEVLVANKLCKDRKINQNLKKQIVENLKSKKAVLNSELKLINGTNTNTNNNTNTNTNTNNNKIKNININKSGNPYTLSAVLGIFFPGISSIIFVVKINKKQHKLTRGDIVLIIVGLIPVISAIVFGILAYNYNQNILDTKTKEYLKKTRDNNKKFIEDNENNINEDVKNNEGIKLICTEQKQKE